MVNEERICKVVSSVQNEVEALNLLSALAQRFGVVGCGYWGKADMERELGRELSSEEYKNIRRQWSENAEPTGLEDEMRWHR